ncbi:MAG: ABC transporter permease [Chloroflexi bacterium]|nr:ABC transporter permease [Chloroflexota bacterium]MCY3583065.1 ABC transporter permease [Chloroflexota bacterium]MCY3716024.1 ABC transporter permease [Chloroflexota bacterium]MDE2652058.1 ABC transporter permease [Chloroflexota bacterium]MXV93642.1 ABC transporter permease [Chloroflexota bacterium]
MAMHKAKDKVAAEALRSKSLTELALSRLRRDRLTMISIGVLLFLTIAAITAPLTTRLLGVDPNTTDASESKYLPLFSEGHLLGTDNLGRDHLARLLYAGQVSLFIGFMSAFLALAFGVTLGIITGYYGGLIDDLVNWIITTLNSIPVLVLLVVITSLFRPSAEALILSIVLITWTPTTRLVRGETLAIRAREYIVGAKAIGASDMRVMQVHILPNVFSLTIVTLARNIGIVMLIEAALSFLGLGVQPPTATWGNMLSKSREFITNAPHLMILPGLLIAIVVLCLYIIGDGLRDAFDPTAQY